MSNYHDQIERIKIKLRRAKQMDASFKVFGADRHKYVLKPSATENEVTAFEKQYSLQLPECYRSFLLHIGNGGIGYTESAAGPDYGIYPLGKHVDELVFEKTEKYLLQECQLHPDMTDEYWKSLNANMDTGDETADDHFETEQGKIFGGILPISSQGCTYLSGIVLNGAHRGRVVSLDLDRQKPFFAKGNNFLDWYEQWLDDIISGKLPRKS